jgi:hypothetical protein
MLKGELYTNTGSMMLSLIISVHITNGLSVYVSNIAITKKAKAYTFHLFLNSSLSIIHEAKYYELIEVVFSSLTAE